MPAEQRHRHGIVIRTHPQEDYCTVAATWWKHGIIYQIYPRSFQDANDDGVGDLDGIIGRIDYLAWLGVDAIWICPIYPSPMADFGYDITDYCGVDPLFGSFDDFGRLLGEAHQRNIKVILDLVPNHTSDRHPWFMDSRSSHTSRKRDWYIWRDGQSDGSPPNNWMSNFGGSAWSWDAATGQYYYHAFLKEQPDLNWRNPDVRAAIYSVMRFWLDIGVDGFRIDVLWHLMKDAAFRHNPINPGYAPGQPDINRFLQLYSADQPEIGDVVSAMRQVVEAYSDRVLIGEIYLPLKRLVAYYGDRLAGVHLPFNFQLLFTAWKASSVALLIEEYERALPAGAWPNWVLGNHDQKRVATRIGSRQARVAAMLLLTLRGTPTLYYGDEIGMLDVPISSEAAQDPWEKREPGLRLGRDPQRTPMQWDSSRSAGFTNNVPWLPVGQTYSDSNVAGERQDPGSILNLYHRLIVLRRRTPALTRGSYRAGPAGQNVLSYERLEAGQRALMVLNFDAERKEVELPSWAAGECILLSTSDMPPKPLAVATVLILQPDEGVIIGNAATIGAA
jgi:alpha-glucosidase